MTVHILGCGPAGLLAAHAARLRDVEVQVHSIKVPSFIKGAQFIHEPIRGPGQRKPDAMVEFQKWGHREVYAEKVYGDPTAECSWDTFEGEVPAWDMVQLYGELWNKYEDLIIDTEIRYDYIEALLDGGDTVISTITPQGYCQRDHVFVWQDVWINDQCSFMHNDRNVIVYNGSHAERWYRSAMLMGHGSTEWGQDVKEVRRKSRKPLRTECTCLLDQPHFHRAGRFGEFQKGLLVHDAYRKAGKVLDALH